MTGKILAGFIVITALVAGVSLYYLQVYAFYEPVPDGGAPVVLTRLDGMEEPVPVTGFEGIDADSSPIRYRACFIVTMSAAMMTETFEIYEHAEPLTAPGWFDCFDAAAIGAALESGAATAFLGQKDIEYGIDRVIAVFGDGRAYAWNQINECGAVVFDGARAPEGCPPVPEGQ